VTSDLIERTATAFVTTRHSELLTHARDPRLRLFAVGVAVLIYAVELASFTLSIDEELHAYDARPWRSWISQGRWSMGLLTYIVPPLATTPFLPTALFCAGLVTSALLLACCYARSRAEAFAFVGFFVSCPIWLHIAEFNTLSWGFGVGLSVAAGAVLLLHAGGYRAAIMAGIATSVAIGVYQSLFLFVVCGSMLSVSLRLLGAHRSEPISLKRIAEHLGPLAVSWLIALLLYQGASAISLFLSNQTLIYVDSYLRLADFTSAATSSAAMARTISRVSGLLSGTDPMFLGWGTGSLLLAWLGAGAAIVRSFQAAGGSLISKLLAAVLMLGSTFVAVVPMIVSAGIGPLRALPALPLVYAVAAATAMKNNWIAKVPHWLIFSFALFINAWIAATLFNADAIARDRDRMMAGQLADRIARIPGFQRDQARPLILVGEWAHEIAGPAVRVEIFGSSFFEHDDGNPYRVASYLRLLGIRGLRPEQITQVRDDIAEIERLPAWPLPGSVAVIHDKLVIKLGPLSYAQRAALSQ